MKIQWLFLILLIVMLLLSLLSSCDGYESRYDSIGPEAIINNKRLYQKYFECIVRGGRCTPDARFIKEVVGDAMPTLCERCNERQRYFADTIIAFMIDNKPEDFKELEQKYDPSGVYRTDLEKRRKKSAS